MRTKTLKTLAVAAITLAAGSLWSAETPTQTASSILQDAAAHKSADKRTNAARALGLIMHDPKATAMAEKALEDEKTDVRAAAVAVVRQNQIGVPSASRVPLNNVNAGLLTH